MSDEKEPERPVELRLTVAEFQLLEAVLANSGREKVKRLSRELLYQVAPQLRRLEIGITM